MINWRAMRRPRATRSARAALGVALTSALVMGPFALSTNACGGDPSAGSTPPPLATGAAPAREAGPDEAAAPVDASPVDAGPQSRRFAGTLATSQASAFGGSPYCNYRMTMTSVDVDVTVTGAGDIANASVSNVAVEETVGTCMYAPLGPNLQKYYLASSSKLPDGRDHLELARDPLNRTAATLILEGDFRGDDVKALLEWQRTDQTPLLNWRVTTTVSLVRR